MKLSLSCEPAVGVTAPGLEEYPSLKLRHVSEELTLLVDPDTVFWALTTRNGKGEKQQLKEAAELFIQQKEGMVVEMETFRYKIDLSAVYINATDRCNGACPYCYIPQKDRSSGRDMSPADLRTVLNKIETYHRENCKDKERQPVIVFHGSEPLMVKETIFPIIEEFSSRMRFGVQTNAVFLTKRDVDFLKEKRVSVGISLDNSSEEQNSATRVMGNGKSAYKSAVSALEWFDGYPGLSVITTISRHNVGSLAETIKFLHSYGVKAVLMNPVRCTAGGTELLRPNNGELFRGFKAAVETAMELTASTGREIVISDFANIILAIVAPTARRLMCDITPCGGGRRFFTVMSDMSTVPCGEFIGLEPFRSANLLEKSVEEVLNSEAFASVRKRVVESIDECSECLYRNICGAPCPAEVFAVTGGDMNRPSPYCEFYRELIDYAFQLIGRGQVKNLLRREMLGGMKQIYSMNQHGV